MPRIGQYAFYATVAGISLLTGTLPFILAGFLSLVFIFFSCSLLYQVLIVKKKAPMIAADELFKKNKTDYNIATLDPVMLDSLNDLYNYFSKNTDGSERAIAQNFCSYFDTPMLVDSLFLLPKKILFEYKKQNGSLKKKIIQLNKIKLTSLLAKMPNPEKAEFCKFCLEADHF